MVKQEKKLYQIFLISLFLLIFQSIFSIREIPHTIIKENPVKEVTEINTLKKREKDAELNLTITKVKSKNIDLKIDFERKKMFAVLEDLKEGDRVFIVDKLEDIPNSSTNSGRKALNKIKNTTTSSNFNFEIFNLKTRNNYKKLEINFNQIPKETFIGITGADYKLKNIYKGNYINYNIPKNNSVNIKLWLFGEDLDKLTNLIINPSKNSTGNIMIRSNSDYSYPEGALERSNLHTVFDINGRPISFDFEDSDTLEIENMSGISGIINNQGSFYKNRNKYVEFSMPGYKVKSRVWSDYSGIELSLEKSGSGDGYIRFTLVQKNSSNEIIQRINFEIFVNNQDFKEYFKFKSFLTQKKFSSSYLNTYNTITLDNKIKDFVSESLEIQALNPHEIEKRYGETGNTEIYISEYPMKYTTHGFGISSSKRINASIPSVEMYIKKEWYKNISRTAQFFTSDGIELIYGKGKRRVPVRSRFGLYGNWVESTELLKGILKGLPLLDVPLDKNNINGFPVIEFEGGTIAFRFVQSRKKFKIYANGKEIKEIDQLSDSLTFAFDGVEYGMRHMYDDDGYKHYYLTIKKLELREDDREAHLKGIDDQGSTEVSKDNRIKIPKFNPKILLNKYNSSIINDIYKIEDVSSKFIENIGKKSIDLGSIYFYQLKTEILKQNSSQNPQIKLANSVYLEAETNVTNKIIEATLSFEKNSKVNEMEMNISGSLGGGNGKNIYLNLSEEEYKKFILNGGNVTYNLKVKNNEKISEIIFIANKSPFGNSTHKEFKEEIIDSVTIKTREVTPSGGEILFKENTPLLKGSYFGILGNNIKYSQIPTDGYNYNQTISFNGSVDPYNYNLGKHNIEIIDASGKIISSIIGSSGSGSHWENIDIGDGNKISLSYNKNDGKTYMSLSNWNFEKTSGRIIIKHFSGATENISQYYNFNFKIPKFNPYIYYNRGYDSQSIDIGDTIDKNIQVGVNRIILGSIATNNYHMDITKHEEGNLRDYEGLRIEGNRSVSIVDEETGHEFFEKGKIILVDTSENEIMDNKIIGSRKYAKVILEIPENLPRNKNYKISSLGIDKLFSNENNYILKIGRTKYFKEIIKEIRLKGELLLKGESTLKITGDYKNGEKINFKTITYSTLDKLQLKEPIPTGVFLENTQGYGILKVSKEDKVYLKKNNTSLEYLGEIDTLGNLKNIPIELSKNNKIEIFFKSGALGFVMNERVLGGKILDDLELIIEREGKNIIEHKLRIILPESWFIIREKEGLDFGNIPAGTENHKTNGYLYIEASKDLDINNIGYKLESNSVGLKPNKPLFNSKAASLVANIISSSLSKTNISYEYLLNIDAKIDIPRDAELGDQKGILEITIFVKE